MKVTDVTAGLSFTANLYRWLATDEGDRSIDVTTEIPIGSVSLAEGILKKVYLGYISRQFSNQGSSDTVYDEAITILTRKGAQ